MSRLAMRSAPFAISTPSGTNSGLTMANSASLNPTAAVTLEIWFYLESLSSSAAVLFDNSETGITNSYYTDILTTGNTGTFRWFSVIGGVARNITSTTTRVKLKQWNFYTATFTGTAVYLYLNGVKLTEEITGITGALGTNPQGMRIGRSSSGASSGALNGRIWTARVYSAGCTLAEHQDRFFRGITSSALQAARVLDLQMSEGSGTTIADASGNGNTATLGTGVTWSTLTPFFPRATITTRADIGETAAATGTITVTDYQFLAGKPTTVDVTVTDWTAMTGGILDILSGVVVVVEGVDFTASVSNNQTAIDFAAAIDTAAGESISSVVGNVITLSIPGENDGASITWSTGGVTLSAATFTGGFDSTQVNFGPTNTVFGSGTAIGASNDDAAMNLAATINGAEGGVVTAVPVGAVVTITYNTEGASGNTWVTTETAANGGTTSGGLTFSGATLSGGATGRAIITNRTNID